MLLSTRCSSPIAALARWATLIVLAATALACDPSPVTTDDDAPTDLEVTVEGTVTEAADDAPLENASITAYRPDDPTGALETTTSTADGSYALDLSFPPDDIPDSLRVDAEASNFVSVQSTHPLDPDTPTLSVDFALAEVEVEVTLSGQVTDAVTADSVAEATITGRGDDGRLWFETTTDVDGAYTSTVGLDTPPEAFTLTAEADGYEQTEESVAFDEELSVDFALNPGFAGGTGTADDPFQIATADHLQNVQAFLEKHFLLTQDIDASETAAWNEGQGFDPIGFIDGTDEQPFTGTFDGNGHTISGLTIDRPDTDGVGLFGLVAGGTIESVRLTDTAVTGNWAVGGLIGRSDSSSVVRAAQADGALAGERWVGGLIGLTGGSVDESDAEGTATGRARVGGLVGANTGTITASRAAATVLGTANVGGLAGGNTGTIRAAYARGDVAADDVGAGGLVGRNFEGTIEETYATGAVSASDNAGGLVGENLEDRVLTDSHWDVQTTDQSDAIGDGDDGAATGLSTSEMTGEEAAANMSVFDFQDTWTTTEDYPILQWEVP